MVLCAGKTVGQAAKIIAFQVRETAANLLATRASPGVFEAVRDQHPGLRYNALGRTIGLRRRPVEPGKGHIAIVTAGTSDLPVAEEAAELLGSPVERLVDVGVAGVHRLLAHRARLRSTRVLIVVAGMEGTPARRGGGPRRHAPDRGPHQCRLWGKLRRARRPARHAQ
mgnify:CR=1 FL=1